MKPTFQTALVLLYTFTQFAASKTIYEALSQDSGLSDFYKMINKDEVLQVLLDRRRVTIFAPTNDAIRRAAGKRPLNDTKLASFHVTSVAAKKELFPVFAPPYLAGMAPLFLSMKETERRKPKEYFVNNAKIIRENVYRGTEGDEQLLYVIDELLEPYKPITTLPPTAMDLLKQPSIYNLTDPLDAFSTRVRTDEEKNVFQRVGNHTFFLPIGTVDNENFKKLQDTDKYVVKGHVIAKHVLFTRTMSRKSYKSETYDEKGLKVELRLTTNKIGDNKVHHHRDDDIEWFIESNTIQGDARHRKGVVRAKIVKPNIPVSNGVVHLISHPLIIIDQQMLDLVEKEKDNNLKTFYSLVNKDPNFISHLRNAAQKTVFAPTDKAFKAIDGEKLRNIKENASAARNLLDLHMVMQSVATIDVWNSEDKFWNMMSSDNQRNLYFRAVGEDRNRTLTVEGGGVNATAVMADLGATNGILHVINRVLGMPYLTVYSKLEHDPDLHTTFKLSEQEEWNLKLNDKEKSYTFFVPNRKAWEDLSREMPSEHKQLHLGQFSYHVHKILDRHLVVGSQLTKEDLQREDKIQMVHGMFKISPGYQNGKLIVEWEGLQANIVRPDVKATNGIIHVIDRVMMKRRDLTKGGSSTLTTSTSLLLMTVLFLTFSEKFLNKKL